MVLKHNSTSRNNNLKEYAPLQKVWEANASGSSGKMLAKAKTYLQNLPALIGTGPFTAIILDLQTTNFQGFIGDFRRIFGIDYQEDMNMTTFVPQMYPSHSTFVAEHFATYLKYILPLSLKERNQVNLSIVFKYIRGNKYYWICIRIFKYFSDRADNLGYAILEYTDITQVKNDNCAKFILYDKREGYVVNETLHPNCSKLDGLTPTELSTTKLIAQGLSDKEIADVQSSAVGTIKKHKKNIFSKLGINKSIELVAMAYDCGLVS